MASERDRYQREARTDPLTALGNRLAWDEAIGAAESNGTPTALLAFDVNGLKQTNDTLGHAFSDRLLRGAAAVLRDATRDADLVARLGGDEFGVLLYGGDEASACRSGACRIGCSSLVRGPLPRRPPPGGRMGGR